MCVWKVSSLQHWTAWINGPISRNMDVANKLKMVRDARFQKLQIRVATYNKQGKADLKDVFEHKDNTTNQIREFKLNTTPGQSELQGKCANNCGTEKETKVVCQVLSLIAQKGQTSHPTILQFLEYSDLVFHIHNSYV